MIERLRRVTHLELAAMLGAVLIGSSLAIPAFNGYVERAKIARAVSDIGTKSLQLHRWLQDTGTLPANLAEADLAGNDPWGRPYVYLRVGDAPRGNLRKNDELVPINTDFDLYSRGADGQSGPPLAVGPSRDDVVRADDGDYIGLAINY